MNTKIIIHLLVLIICLTGCKSNQQKNGSKERNKQPNIIFIMADDLGWQDVGFMGSEWFETPNLDNLAKESLVFTHAYMYPTCSSSRAALLTGRQSFRTGIYNVPVLERGNNQDNIFSRWTVGLEHPVFAKPLRKAGYKLAHFGKWHIVGPNPDKEKDYPFKKKLGQPSSGDTSWIANHKTERIQQYYPIGRGFHENVGGTWWGDPARGYINGYNTESGGYKAPFKNPFIVDKDDDDWLTNRLTNDAIDFIDRNKEGPFMLNINYYAVHRPNVVKSKAWLEKFLNKEADLITGQGETNRQTISEYATMVQSLDNNVQRLIDYLDKEGIRENTVIIFTSDNGFNGLQSVNKRLRGAKGYAYEGGIRVPAFVNWKGKTKSGISEVPICGLDYFPTFLDLAGVKDYNKTLDGNSIVPLLKGKELQSRSLFWHIASTYKNPPCSIIRKGDWKLIQFLLDGKVELYNLENDLSESIDLVKVEIKQTKSMLEELIEWRIINNVPLPPASILEF